MATVARTFLVDDLNGSTEDDATIQFNLDGTSYEIDLSIRSACGKSSPNFSTRPPPSGHHARLAAQQPDAR